MAVNTFVDDAPFALIHAVTMGKIGQPNMVAAQVVEILRLEAES